MGRAPQGTLWVAKSAQVFHVRVDEALTVRECVVSNVVARRVGKDEEDDQAASNDRSCRHVTLLRNRPPAVYQQK